MSKVIAIIGESGSGKTTSMRNLNTEETYYIDCDGKGLSWKGWREQFNSTNKNYKRIDDAIIIEQIITNISLKAPQIKYIIIDTINAIMNADEMRRAKEKGYDKWQDLASCVFNLIKNSYNHRDDLTIVFLAHSQTERDESGFMFTRLKTNGKKLDKICLESYFTTVLLAKCIDGKYLLETKSNNSTIKTPMGAFESDVIDNDINIVIEALKDY